MKDKVLSIVKEYDLIKENENIVIGVSGGPDSMALLYILLELKESIDFKIFVAHLNHGVRGKDAKKDQLFVEEECKKLNLPYYTKTISMVEYGKEKGITAEEAGRELRYGFFREILKKQGGGKIAVAHNKNDQAETVIMRFMRGTGIDGLKGMEFISEDIIRPILSINRAEIENYIEEKKIETVLDKTNLQPIYSRNKVRLELIPYIEENFNPNIIDTIWRISNLSQIDSEFLEKHSKKLFNQVVIKDGKNSIILDGRKILELDRSIQQRIIRNGIGKINGTLQGITESHVIFGLNLLLNGHTGKSINIINNIVIRLNYNELIIEKEINIKKKDYIYELKYPGVEFVEELGYSFNMEIIDFQEGLKFEKSKYIGYFDLDKINGDLFLRNRRAGDRFTPFGMKGSKKIKDYFIDEKINKESRDIIPILTDKNHILWLVGYRTSERYKINRNTEKILKITYKQV